MLARYRRAMKALVKSARQPGLWLEDVAAPKIGIVSKPTPAPQNPQPTGEEKPVKALPVQ